MFNRLRVLKPPDTVGMPPWQAIRFIEGPAVEPQPILPALPNLNILKILIPFAFSDTSAMLLRHIVRLAKRTGAVVHLLHVVEPISLATGKPRRDHHTEAYTKADAAQTILTLWRDRIIRGCVPSFATVQIGQRVDEIVARAEKLGPDLIVMTVHGDYGPVGSFSPGTAEQVIRHAACPVLTFPAERVRDPGPDYDGFPPSNWKTVLMPVDFSKAASRALKFAAAITAENHAKLVLLNIMLEGARIGAGLGGDGDCRALERKGKQRLKKWVAQELISPVQFEAVVWPGIPSAWAVPVEARLSKVDVIITPIRKGSAPKPSNERSTIDGILRNASCPILSI